MYRYMNIQSTAVQNRHERCFHFKVKLGAVNSMASSKIKGDIRWMYTEKRIGPTKTITSTHVKLTPNCNSPRALQRKFCCAQLVRLTNSVNTILKSYLFFTYPILNKKTSSHIKFFTFHKNHKYSQWLNISKIL